MAVLPSCACRVPIFQVLPEEGLRALGDAMHHRPFEKGEIVAAAGDPVQHLMIVAEGRLQVVHSTAGGRAQVVRSLGPGEFLGELALFSPARHEGDLVAMEDTQVCMVSRDAVQEVLRAHPAVALRLVESLAQRLSRSEQLVADLSLRDVGQRLAAELVRAAEGKPSGPDGIRVQLEMTWHELAAQLGTTPESLSRRLKGLAAQGIIAQGRGRTVTIRNLQQLKHIAEA